jgi:cyclopropane-fatty-acyl-phospholipid synthase
MSAQLLETPSKHSWSVVALADAAYHHAKELAFRSSWSPLAKLAEAAVVSLMERLEKGQLRIITPSRVYIFPRPGSAADKENPMPDLKAELRVVNDSTWIRMCTMSDLGFAEAYMYGEISCDDLMSLFKLFIYNKDAIAGLNSAASYLFSIPSRLTSTRFINTISNSRSNISAHYDISNAMFEGFLSKDMTYSCAIFSELDSDLNTNEDKSSGETWSANHVFKQIYQRQRSSSSSSIPSTAPPEYTTDDLHSAQMRKLHHIIGKAHIRPGHRVLEIGSGWGSMAIAIARLVPDTQIDSLTLSVAQRDLAMQRIRKEGLQDRIRIHLLDYRDMPAEWKGAFDRFVSIEMLEAVGQEFMATFWKQVEWALKPRNGVGVVQCITMPDARFDQYCSEIDFIRKWVCFEISKRSPLPPLTITDRLFFSSFLFP